MIRVREVRLVDVEGKQLGIYPTYTARQMAEDYGLDLIEINPTARPPVCKLMSYGKYKFDLKKRDKEIQQAQHKIVVKQINFHPNTQEHDYSYRLEQAKEFISKGWKVKATVKFRGREMNFLDNGKAILDTMVTDLNSVATVEVYDMENKVMFVVFKPL